MINQKILFSLAIVYSIQAHAQTDTSKEVSLQEVVVKAFEQNRKLKDIPAAVNYVSPQAMDRFSPSSLVAAINTTPGIRMEERSPGSYRFNIRGSALRSPFGVRNVKIYYNDLPFTDPGGQSYLNQLGFYNFHSVEIIKGPGSSLYGAGTGGVMLIESLEEKATPSATLAYTAGSYGMQNMVGSLTTSTDKVSTRTTLQRFLSDGYRNQSELKRTVLSWNGLFQIDKKRQLKTSFLYSDLSYETPGALTLAEYKANPKAARPGAEAAKAAIYQKMFIAGASYTQQLSSWLVNKSSLYGAFTELRNPNLRAYDRSSEPHVGGRSVFIVEEPVGTARLKINAGAEWQQGFAAASSYKNVSGKADSLRFYDDINNRQSFVFAQASIDVANWLFTAGASYNQLHLKTQRFTPRALGEQTRKFDNELAPRFSVLKKIDNITLYSSVAKGFSPPTTSELLPTGGNINLDLEPEHGVNYDLGVRATFFNKLYVDVNGFVYSLRNTIVQRRDALGGDFYVNAGKTKQHGIETYLSYPLFTTNRFVSRSLFWLSHTWHNFHYKEFEKLTDDFSGRQMPGEAPHSLSAGIDFETTNGLSAHLTYTYSDKVPLNDANTAFANSYNLMALKLGYEKAFKLIRCKLFAGIENLFDEDYSLGNDINGFGGRYYNAAPGRSYFGGISLSLLKKKIQE